MSWYDNIPSNMHQGQSYPRKTVLDWMEGERPGLGLSGYHWAINQLIKNGAIAKTGHDEYSLPNGKILREYVPGYSEEATFLLDKLGSKFPYVPFTVFETVLMNNFLNHLIAQNTIFLQVEKDSSIYVFRYLQEEGVQNLMFRPSINDLRLYWSNGTVIVTDLVSEAPMRMNQPHVLLLEKMLVDMCADKLIGSTFSKAELSNVFDIAVSQYQLDRSKLFRYARRRNKEAEVKKYLKESA